MKLLLTSGGITNKTIANALLELVGKKAEEINLAFIPTAANAERNDKSWFIDNLYQLKQQKYKMVDIVDISALPKWNWQSRLEAADVIFVSGGVTSHLMYWINKSGLQEMLPELLKTRIWVGVSAGSIVMSPTLLLTNVKKAEWYKEKFGGLEIKEGLGFVNFYIRPHMNAPYFPNYQKDIISESVKQTTKNISEPVYILDDQMALKVIDGKVEVIGEGEYVVFNK